MEARGSASARAAGLDFGLARFRAEALRRSAAQCSARPFGQGTVPAQLHHDARMRFAKP